MIDPERVRKQQRDSGSISWYPYNHDYRWPPWYSPSDAKRLGILFAQIKKTEYITSGELNDISDEELERTSKLTCMHVSPEHKAQTKP